jgi:hypothetical protein
MKLMRTKAKRTGKRKTSDFLLFTFQKDYINTSIFLFFTSCHFLFMNFERKRKNLYQLVSS